MLVVYTIEQAEQWDGIVRSFSQYDVYWMSGYVKAFLLHGDGTPLLFYYEKDGTRGIHVVMKRDIAHDSCFNKRIPEGKFYDFATPYGYGGWIVEGENSSDLYHAYENWMHKNGIISEFVRFHPMIKNHEMCRDFYEVIQLGEVVHMELDSPETIWENLSSKNRNMIRKAIKNGVRIYNGRFPEIYESFREIYNETMRNDDADDYYYFDKIFYKSLLEDLPYNSQVFYAVKDDEIIAASIVISANGKMNYHLSGSVQKYRNLAPTNLLLYEASLWGYANGYKTFYLGGGVGSVEDNLFRFKKSFFRGSLNHFYIGKKIYDPIKYDELVSMRTVKNEGFFPKYRG